MMNRYILTDASEPEPCDDLMTWANWFQTADKKVASDDVNDVHVSTVFLGLDHSFGTGAPVLWETMIFGGVHDGYQDRYTSRADAVAGHQKALAMVRG